MKLKIQTSARMAIVEVLECLDPGDKATIEYLAEPEDCYLVEMPEQIIDEFSCPEGLEFITRVDRPLLENYDGMMLKDLNTHVGLLRQHLAIVSPEDKAGYEGLLSYANHKQQAMVARSVGRITIATNYEKECVSIYRKLPEWAKW